MFRLRLPLLASLVCVVTCAASTASSQPATPVSYQVPTEVVTLEMFEAELAASGDWVVVPSIGRAWRPAARVVGSTFVPYKTQGHWTYTEDGWTFESDYSWGWATFHYGRWARDVTHGWVWVPGFTWAPSWVMWRSGDGHVGWVAAPPSAFRVITAHWTFVEEQHFLEPRLAAHAVPPRLVAAVFRRTLPSTAYVMRSGARWNTGPSVSAIARAAHTAIRPAPRRPMIPARVRTVADSRRD